MGRINISRNLRLNLPLDMPYRIHLIMITRHFLHRLNCRRWRTALVLCLLLGTFPSSSRGGEAELEQLMEKMENDVLEFASLMETFYAERCGGSSDGDGDNETAAAPRHNCSEAGDYHECHSLFPEQTCVGSGGLGSLSRPECMVEGMSCGGLYDFTVSSIRLSPHVQTCTDGNPKANEVKEALCYSRRAEEYMIRKYNNSVPYWAALGVGPPQIYFGAENGAFRIFPARQSTDNRCGKYDTTRRPWYVAATSGPKDVILILDVSGSMGQRGRLGLMKDAAVRVIDTLAVGDHVGIVTFNESVGFSSGDMLMQATDGNKAKLKAVVETLEAGGSTNFLDAFDRAFDMISESKRVEETSDCHSAILFLTDGKMSYPQGVTAGDVISLIQRRERELGVNPYIFMYGLGAAAQYGAAAEDPKRIACATGGMWSFVEDGGDLTSAMTNYYKLFALGLGVYENENFRAWVDPYKYATGNVLGTTVAAPVYNRRVTPHVLIGAVGLDMTMAAMDAALGVAAGSRETLDRFVDLSTPICPRLNLGNCEIQSLRLEAGGDKALCPGECNMTDLVGIRPKCCNKTEDLPQNFIHNFDNRGRSFEERTCCAEGETRRSGNSSLTDLSRQCVLSALEARDVAAGSASQAVMPSGRMNSKKYGVLAGIVIGTVVAIALTVVGCACFARHYASSIARLYRLMRTTRNDTKDLEEQVETLKRRLSFSMKKIPPSEGARTESPQFVRRSSPEGARFCDTQLSHSAPPCQMASWVGEASTDSDI